MRMPRELPSSKLACAKSSDMGPRVGALAARAEARGSYLEAACMRPGRYQLALPRDRHAAECLGETTVLLQPGTLGGDRPGEVTGAFDSTATLHTHGRFKCNAPRKSTPRATPPGRMLARCKPGLQEVLHIVRCVREILPY